MTDIWLAVSGGKPHVDALLATGAIGASAEIDVDRLKVGEDLGAAQLDAVLAQRPALLHVSQGAIWPRGRRWAAARARLAERVGTGRPGAGVAAARFPAGG